MVYKWKDDCRIGADPEKIGAELEMIADEHRTADMVVEFARKNKKSELYSCFEWDDSVAARKHRAEQARLILRMIVTEVECPVRGGMETITVRAYEAVAQTSDEDDEDAPKRQAMVYVPLMDALSDEVYRDQVMGRLRATIAQAEATATKYSKLAPQLKRTAAKLREARETVEV